MERFSNWVRDEYNFNQEFATWLVFYASEAYIRTIKEEYTDKVRVRLDPKSSQPHLSLVDGARKLKIEISAANQKDAALVVEGQLGSYATKPNEYGWSIVDNLAEKAATHLVVWAAGQREHDGNLNEADDILGMPEEIVAAFLNGDDFQGFEHKALDYCVSMSTDANVQFLAQDSLVNKSESYLEHLLRLRNGGVPFARDGYLLTCNAAVFNSVQRMVTLNAFEVDPKRDLPRADISQAGNVGQVFIQPLGDTNSVWDTLRQLNTEDADAMNLLMAVYIKKAERPDDVACVDIDDLLRMRGLKEKSHGGVGRRHGFSQSQRRQMLESIRRLEELWIEMAKLTLYGNGKPKIESIESRAFTVTDRIKVDGHVRKIAFQPGRVFSLFLFGPGRQLGVISVEILRYHPIRQAWEKNLGRYISLTFAVKGPFRPEANPNSFARNASFEKPLGEDLPSFLAGRIMTFCACDVFAQHQPQEGRQGSPLFQHRRESSRAGRQDRAAHGALPGRDQRPAASGLAQDARCVR
jgi:hypothetical protein